MAKLNSNKLITYVSNMIKYPWSKAAAERQMNISCSMVANDSTVGTNDRGPASSIQHPKSSIKFPATNIQHPDLGFTLLEVLIAMAIMAIVLVSVYRMQSQTLTMTAASRFYTEAPLLAQSKLAQLEANASELISGESGDFGELFPGYSWRVSTGEVSSDVLGETAGDLKRIDLTVVLNENEYEYSIRTYLFVGEQN